jgi:hypothetical protein
VLRRRSAGERSEPQRRRGRQTSQTPLRPQAMLFGVRSRTLHMEVAPPLGRPIPLPSLDPIRAPVNRPMESMITDRVVSTLALLCCFGACAVMARGFGRSSFPSSVLDLVLFGMGVFHVLPELLRLFVDIPAGPYREGLPPAAIESWLIVASVCVLAFGAGAALTRTLMGPPPVTPPLASRPLSAAESIFTSILVAVAIASALIVIIGMGYGGYDTDNYVLGGTVSTTVVPALISVAVLSTLRWRLSMLVVAAIALVLLLMGSRSLVGWALLAGVVLVRRCGGTIRTSKLTVAVAVCAAVVVAIALIRDRAGRWSQDATLHDRIGTVAEASSTPVSTSNTSDLVLDSFVHRIDGNGYGARVLHAQSQPGKGLMGAEALTNSVLLAIPSFIWSTKLDTPVEARNQEAASILHYDIEVTDYLPTVIGSATSMFGWPGAILVAGVFGVAVSALDRLLTSRQPHHLPIAAAICLVALNFDGNVETVILGCRTVATVALLTYSAWWLARAISAVLGAGAAADVGAHS